MRPRNEDARDRLLPLLARRPGAAAAELAAALGVSVPTLHRLLSEQPARVLAGGRARRTRYALRRALRGVAGDIALYTVDREGRAAPAASLSLLQPAGSHLLLQGLGLPVPEPARDGWWPGLPYPLHDMRPQGCMGRQLARAEHERQRVSTNPAQWSDDDVVHMLLHFGHDTSGHLILGDPAFERWQRSRVEPAEPLAPRAVPRAYAQLAGQAVSAGAPGSSAAGEFPKFAAMRTLAGSATPHVLVKFSAAGAGRWADLLVCEHLALERLAAVGVAAARSRVVQHEGRTFLELERFDRHGAFGRTPLLSLATLDAELLGAGSSDWRVLAARLHAGGWLAPDALPTVARLWWFGRLIANSDMHTGNLSFTTTHPGPQPDQLELAPAYDMLPMAYAPLPSGELPTRGFEPPLPLPAERESWFAAGEAAHAFWLACAGDARISDDFRRECAANATRLAEVAARL